MMTPEAIKHYAEERQRQANRIANLRAMLREAQRPARAESVYADSPSYDRAEGYGSWARIG